MLVIVQIRCKIGAYQNSPVGGKEVDFFFF